MAKHGAVASFLSLAFLTIFPSLGELYPKRIVPSKGCLAWPVQRQLIAWEIGPLFGSCLYLPPLSRLTYDFDDAEENDP